MKKLFRKKENNSLFFDNFAQNVGNNNQCYILKLTCSGCIKSSRWDVSSLWILGLHYPAAGAPVISLLQDYCIPLALAGERCEKADKRASEEDLCLIVRSLTWRFGASVGLVPPLVRNLVSVPNIKPLLSARGTEAAAAAGTEWSEKDQVAFQGSGFYSGFS